MYTSTIENETIYTSPSNVNIFVIPKYIPIMGYDMLLKTKHQLPGMKIFYVFESIIRASRSDERCLYDPSEHATILRYKCIMR